MWWVFGLCGELNVGDFVWLLLLVVMLLVNFDLVMLGDLVVVLLFGMWEVV